MHWGSTIGLSARDGSIQSPYSAINHYNHGTKPQLPPASLSLAANIRMLLFAAYFRSERRRRSLVVSGASQVTVHIRAYL